MASRSRTSADEIGNLLNACLELVEGGEVSIEALLAGYKEFREVLRPPLEAALWLYRKGWLFDPRPAFVSACRGRIVECVQAESGMAMTARSKERQTEIVIYPRWNFLSLLIAVPAILVLIWVGAKSLSFWVGNSLPGDSLYGAKLAREQAELAFSLSPRADAESSIEFVEMRYRETERLIIAGGERYLPDAVGNLNVRLDGALHAIEELGAQDPDLAASYAGQLEITLAGESEKLAAMREFYSPACQEFIDQVLALSADALQAIAPPN